MLVLVETYLKFSGSFDINFLLSRSIFTKILNRNFSTLPENSIYTLFFFLKNTYFLMKKVMVKSEFGGQTYSFKL